VAIQGRACKLQSAEWQHYFCSAESRSVGCPTPAAVPGFSVAFSCCFFGVCHLFFLKKQL